MKKSDSIFKKRIRKFKATKRGYYSLIILIIFFVISLTAPFTINNYALIVKANNNIYFPAINNLISESFLSNIFSLDIYEPKSLAQEPFIDSNNNGIWDLNEKYEDLNSNKKWDKNDHIKSYRMLKKHFQTIDDSYVILPLYPYGPYELDILSELDEEFIDKGNGIPDGVEEWFDCNGNNIFDEDDILDNDLGNNRWDPDEPFVDLGNNKWDENEFYFDENGNCEYDQGEEFIDVGNGKWDKGEKFTDTNNNNKWDEAEIYIDSNNDGKYNLSPRPATFPYWMKSLILALNKLDFLNIFTDFEIKEIIEESSRTYNILGTDNQGRDVFARLIYAFKISLLFAIIVWSLSYTIGIIVGSTIGYIGGKLDLFGYRIIEIYSSMPFLFLLMILASFIKPSIFILATMYVLITGWIGISWYVRGEFLREKSKDYVSAAVSMGQSHTKIIFKHILPNALTPIVTFAPFGIMGYISGLVSLDYLGFGLQPPTPSWGEMVSQGVANLQYWHLVLFPLLIIGITLFLITLIGEAVRSAFDPKVHSRLR